MASLVLTGDTSGQVTIAAPAVAGTNTLTLPALTGTILTDKTVGTVLQVVSTFKNDGFSSTSTSFVDITGLSVSITPTSTTSKILVLVTSNFANSSTGAPVMFNLLRNSTNIAQPSTAPTFSGTVTPYVNLADNSLGWSINFLDSPATTSATTYKIQGKTSGGTFGVNRRSLTDFASVSTITVMEIAA